MPSTRYGSRNSPRSRDGREPSPVRSIAVELLDIDPDRDAPAERRILVIEDDPNLSEVVERYLDREGFDVERIGDGDGGLKRALEWLPDLVVLDVMLPGLDGMEVCRRIRDVAPIPVVMLTALAAGHTARTPNCVIANGWRGRRSGPRNSAAMASHWSTSGANKRR